MMVGVQESQGFLLQDKEDGVDQLNVFGQVIQLKRLLAGVLARRLHIGKHQRSTI